MYKLLTPQESSDSQSAEGGVKQWVVIRRQKMRGCEVEVALCMHGVPYLFFVRVHVHVVDAGISLT
jgi:hypothetical protein